ncbi:MAG: hypothetical protein J6Y93_00465 [Treponema sp.]|nr:hypothetical protein [Treponema sp.]
MSVKTDSEGAFSAEADISELPDAVYFITVRCRTKDGFLTDEVKGKGFYILNRSHVLPEPPSEVLLFRTGEASMNLSWKKKSGKITGFKLYKNDDSEPVYIGDITQIDFPYYDADSAYAVSSVDASGRESILSDFVNCTDDPEDTALPYLSENGILYIRRGETENFFFETGYNAAEIPETDFIFSSCSVEAAEDEIEVFTAGKTVLCSGKGGVKISVHASSSCMEKDFLLHVRVQNRRNMRSFTEKTFTIRVLPPEINIDAVYPSEISSSGNITLYGSGFFEGLSIFLDDTELPVILTENSNGGVVTSFLSENLFASLSNGNHCLSVRASGKSCEKTIKIIKPFYILSVLSDSAECCPGDTAVFSVTLVPFNGFSEAPELYPYKVPEGFSVMTSPLLPSVSSAVTVRISPEIKAGEYDVILKTPDGNEVKLNLNVLSGQNEFSADGISSRVLSYGDTFCIF